MFSSIRSRPRHYPKLVAVLCLFIVACFSLLAQNSSKSTVISNLAWSTDSTGPRRFISVHGRRAAVFGYSGAGLEVWAYPLQIASSYSVSFREEGETTGIDGQNILRRITYSPEAVTRIYAGPDFVICERLFVPLNEPGVIIDYEVDSRRAVNIDVRFIPALDLMWPGSIGGQEALWKANAAAYVLFEPTHRFTASIGSPDTVAHDEAPNTGQAVARAPGLAFTIRAGEKAAHNKARVIISGSGPGEDAGRIAERLKLKASAVENDAIEHYAGLLDSSLQIETPDAETNRALAWAEIALDQAWVCNPDLGCGLVAGYGPSRKARRPQYDWFFSGDGMVAIKALLAAGRYERARQELEFILKYQDQKTGMIWHELSQSAGLIEWVKYPYMYVHVDLTFDFLNTVGDYVAVTGDLDFANVHWVSIQSAYDYCRSLLDPQDGLPRVPVGKEGQREQEPLSDELALSSNWADAAQAFALLADATGHKAGAEQATIASRQAGNAIGKRYWDDARNVWITGYTRSAAALVDGDLGPAQVITKSYFSTAQRKILSDQLSSSDFQADWGSRGKASDARTYDPNSYSSGSVWATGSSATATMFWSEHRPVTALPIWRAMVPWSSLDSLGHMHEALAGDYYHEERESVPEQTWSSATFFASAVHGLLGLQIDGMSDRVTFAPHLPFDWSSVALTNLRVRDSRLNVKLLQSNEEIRLQIQNIGSPIAFTFDPEIPFGATNLKAELDGMPIPVSLEQHSQDTHAAMEFNLSHGTVFLKLIYSGGVAITSEPAHLMIGESSHAIKITEVNLEDRVYTVKFDRLPSVQSSFALHTPWIIESAQGATVSTTSPGLYRIVVDSPSADMDPHRYQPGTVTLTFAPSKTK